METNQNLLKDAERLARDLKDVILPLGIALSAEKSFDLLVERILVEARAICNADAGTFYLRTEDDRLKFVIMQTASLDVALGGSTGRPIPLPPLRMYDENTREPIKHYVATYVALTGTSVNIPDIYQVEGFDFSGTRAFDKENNYRTISSLTVPLKNDENKVMGVIQLLNAHDRETGKVIPFDAYSQQVVESLASQAAVALNNRLLLERQKALLKIERDLQIGRQIQAGFLPSKLIELPNWEISAYFEPARQVSGDFYDVFPLSQDHVALVIADVCNKGVGAALFMTLFRSLLRAFSQQTLSRELAGLSDRQNGVQDGVAGGRLTTLLTDLNVLYTVVLTNNYVARTHGEACMFVTLFFGVLDSSTGTLTYVNAGHDSPAIIGPNGVKERLNRTGPVVGMMPDMSYDIKRTVLEPGDVLYAYTDGVTEARNPANKFFPEKELLLLLEQPIDSAAGLLERIKGRLRLFIDTADQFDDITMLAVRRAPEPSAQRSAP